MKKSYKIDVDCAACALKMEDAANNTPGVQKAVVDFMALKMHVEFEEGSDPEKVMPEVLKNCKAVEDDCEIFFDNEYEKQIEKAEEAAPEENGKAEEAPEEEKGAETADKPEGLSAEKTEETKADKIKNLVKNIAANSDLVRIIAAAVFLIILAFIPAKGFVRFLLYLIPYALVGYDVVEKAVKGIMNHQVFDENFLMTVATIGAFALGEYTEAVAVMLLYQIGELFQSYAVGKSRKNISDLMDIRPDYANIETEDGIRTVAPDAVEIGSIIIVKPGEKIPIDGIVIEGDSSLNTSALTGESVPRDVSAGDEVISGCINMSGLLKVKTTKEFGESTVSKILDLMENSTSNKSKSEDFITKFAKYYTPIVCYCALFLAVVPPILNFFAGEPAHWGSWIYRALTFLVISCPCALVISIPLSFCAGIGGAGSAGILIKGSNYLESLSKVKYLVFDKTGTLTKGNFNVSGVHHNALEDKKLLWYAAHAEYYSDHPISQSLKEACAFDLDPDRVSDVQEISGKGVTAVVEGVKVSAGNSKLMDDLGIKYIPCTHTGTVVHVALDGEYAGHILITDSLKPSAKEGIRSLKELGVKKIVMLTGDRKKAAEEVAAELGGLEVYSELMPQDKVSKVEELLASKDSGSLLGFVGDGINDAPVLARADVGIAMGALGSDAAIEAADVVLMDDDPLKISKSIRISRKCMRIVYENICFAIGVKLICLVLGALGIAGMWLAIFADVGVMVIAVLNAIRALSVKNV